MVYFCTDVASTRNWLQLEARKKNSDALNALNKKRKVSVTGNHVAGGSKKTKSFLDDSLINNVTKNGIVVYEYDSCVIRDYGQSLKITKGADDTAIKNLLEASIEKFGSRLLINGSEEFKERVLKVAVKEKLKVKFGDLNMEKKRVAGMKYGRKGVSR